MHEQRLTASFASDLAAFFILRLSSFAVEVALCRLLVLALGFPFCAANVGVVGVCGEGCVTAIFAGTLGGDGGACRCFFAACCRTGDESLGGEWLVRFIGRGIMRARALVRQRPMRYRVAEFAHPRIHISLNPKTVRVVDTAVYTINSLYWIDSATETREELVALVPLHLFAFFCRRSNGVDDV